MTKVSFLLNGWKNAFSVFRSGLIRTMGSSVPEGAEDLFLWGKAMPVQTWKKISMRFRPARDRITLGLLGMLLAGCASLADQRAPGIASLSYELPASLEPHQVIQAVEAAFSQTLHSPLKTLEGSVQSPLPLAPSDFSVEYRPMHLEQLGPALFPRIVCPRNMAMVSSFAANPSVSLGLLAYAGCMYQLASGYHVHIVAAETGSNGNTDLEAPGIDPNGAAEHVSLVAKKLAELVPGARLVQAFTPTPSAAIVQHPAGAPATKPVAESQESLGQLRSVDAGSQQGSPRQPSHSVDQESPATLPLVCVGPAGESLAVQSQPEGGAVLRVLGPGSLLAIEEPVDSAYLRVRVQGGQTGWIRRSDVRRLLCPIG